MFIFSDVLLTASLDQPGSGWMQSIGRLMRAWNPQGEGTEMVLSEKRVGPEGSQGE